MNNTIRIRTDLGEQNKYLKFQLNQDHDFIEILSLKLRQDDLYRLFCSDYGVVVGRVIANSGFGVPNARVSIFIPIEDGDKENDLISGLYPYEFISDKDFNGTRYNLLPKKSSFDCHTPVGNLPTKREILDNDVMLEIYEKYYKFTTRTNEAGDFMIFGVPTGSWKLNVDVDLSDIGIVSQKPYDFIRQGEDKKLFTHNNKFKTSNNLNDLPQIFHTETTVNVLPFWGDKDNCNVGLNRIDVELSYKIEPQAFFIGSIFGDNEKNSINKNCDARKKLGNLCETVAGEGTIEILRKNILGQIEKYYVDGGRVIDEDGAWAFQVPMNLDYYITDEFGNLIPSDDPNKGVPTRARVRFRIGMDINTDEGRVRQRAKFLVPNNDGIGNYDFDEATPDEHFRDLHWNKIYSVKQFIPRFQTSCGPNCGTNRTFVGIKDVDDCGDHTPFPFNRLDTNGNPLFTIVCVLLNILVGIVAVINRFIIATLNTVLSALFTVFFALVKGYCALKHLTSGNKRGACRCFYCSIMAPDTSEDDCANQLNPCGATCQNCSNDYATGNYTHDCDEKCKTCNVEMPIGYITLECDDAVYMPWYITSSHKTCTDLSNGGGQQTYCNCIGAVSTSTGDYLECQETVLADALNVFKFDFYNDWINGSLYAFLFKHKIKKQGEGRNKFCDYDCDEFPNPTNNDPTDGILADNNCRQNWIVDTCQDIADVHSNHLEGIEALADSASKKEIREGIIKYYKEEYYYAASSHYDYPLFRTDLVLLGSINSCDVHGIPQFYNKIPNTTYNLPPISTEFNDSGDVAVSSIADLLFRVSCGGIDTSERNCHNIKKICELGVGLDEFREDDGTVANTFIDNWDIEDEISRNTFAILNENGVSDISTIATNYTSNVLTYNTNFGNGNPSPATAPIPPVNPLQMGADYYRFRGFATGGNGSPRLPLENSYYFYFGIEPGRTGLDKFYQNYVQECEVEVEDELILSAVTSGVTTYGGSDGVIILSVLNGISPYDMTITYPNNNVYQYNGQTSPHTFNGLETGTYFIEVEDAEGNQGNISVYVDGPAPLSFFADPIPVTSNGGSDGKIIVSGLGGGAPLYDICIIFPLPFAACFNGLDSMDTVEFTNLPSGTYTLEMTDSMGLTTQESINVTEPTVLDVVVTTIQPLCYGDYGQLVISITGGQPPYTYITEGLTTGSISSGLVVSGPAQTYTTTVTDAAGQQVVVNTILTQPPELTATGTYHNPSCYNSTDGDVNAYPAGGTPPYTYAWSKNGTLYGTAQTLSNLAVDTTGTTYSVVITDNNGCTTSLQYILTRPEQLTLTRVVSGLNVSLTATGGNVGTRTFYLTGINGTVYNYSYVTAGMAHTFFSVEVGEYSCKVVDNKGCTAFAHPITIT